MEVPVDQLPEDQLLLFKFTPEQHEKIRAEIHRLNRKWTMWKGIRRCIMNGATFKPYADYQLEWQHNILWGNDIQTVLVGCRFSTKTQLTMESIIKRMAEVPNTWVSWIPGGNMRQYVQAQSYFNTMVDNSPKLTALKGQPWQETTKTFTNGSRIMFLPPTPDGVNSMRANIIVFDEAQEIEPEVLAVAVFQGGQAGSRMIFIGLSRSGTKIDEVFRKSPTTGFKMKVAIQHVLAAGLQDIKYVRNTIASDLLTRDQIDVMYFSKWLKPGGCAFKPQVITELVPGRFGEGVQVPLTGCIGVDFNPSKKHWGVKAIQTIYGDIICLEEFFAGTYNEILEWSPGVRMHAENGGTNSGYCKALLYENAHRIGQRQIIPDEWTEEVKGNQVAECIRLQEAGKLYIYAPGCPILARDVGKIPFNDKNVPDKKKAEKQGLNPHVVDAFIHAVAGASAIPSTDFMLNFFGVRRN